MTLAIFDLDNTLIAGDSDYLWGQFLIEQHVVDGPEYERKNAYYYQAYKDGKLDIFEFLNFSLAPLAQHDVSVLNTWRQAFIAQKIQPLLLEKAYALLESHRQQGHTLMIITATNRFVTEPIAQLYAVDHLLATDPEFVDGKYTGRVAGTPCFQQGKVTRLQAWMREHGEDLQDSWFYSDSHNDLPLLRLVDNPVAVDADDTLQETAATEGWRSMSLR